MAGPPPLVDLSAREAHFLDHLAPIWRALPLELRGTVYVRDADLARHARALGLGPVELGWPLRGVKLGPILVAAFGDLRICSRTRRKVILAEHGAGQSYGNRHSSYVGGMGREAVSLFLVPSEQAAARNRKRYPATKNAVVGCPKLDRLLELEPPTGPPTVAVSFHWRCSVVPETGSAIDDFAPELEKTRRRLEEAGVRMIGHAHPRILDEAAELYDEAGIEVVSSFEEVLERAHLYAVDNSSTLFEFAAIDRPVVVLNARAYRRDVAFGLRFWSEADVGLHAGPGELAEVVLEALDDPPEVAGSRRAAVARAYAVTDGTSSARAAEAIVSSLGLRPPRCLVCGAAHSDCGPRTTVVPIDQRTKEPSKMAGPLKKYPNPARKGAFLKLSDADAKRLGLLGTDVGAATTGARAADVTNPGGDALVSSSSAPLTSSESASTDSGAPDAAGTGSSSSPDESGLPRGAMAPAGPTHRARAAALEQDPDAEDDAAEPVKKAAKKAATSSRRRRKPAEG